MSRHFNPKLYLQVYNKLIDNKCHKVVANELGISAAHVGRIADFLEEQYFIVPLSLKMHIKLYIKTKRIPSAKILLEIIKSRDRKDRGSYLYDDHRLIYRSELKSNITQKVIDWCRLISPKGTKKYLFPPNKNLKLNFNIIIHNGLNKKSVMFYLKRLFLTQDEFPISDEIIEERIQRIAYNVMHFFKIKLGVPKPSGKSREYGFPPKEDFLIDFLKENTFEIKTPAGIIKGDSSGDKNVYNGREIEFVNKNLAMTYINMIPAVHEIGEIVVHHNKSIEYLKQEVCNLKGMLSEIKPVLEKILKYINEDERKNDHIDTENQERGMIN